MRKFKVIDLFAGAGGLSLGFTQTKKFDIKVAFENSSYMQDTYRLNHPGVDVRGDVCSADYAKIQDKYGPIDVVIGGPPCQGFSNANRQRNKAINQNNMLVKQYIRAILELQPQAFVMENVSMLCSKVHRFYLDRKDEQLLEKYNIPVKETELQVVGATYMFPEIVKYTNNVKLVEKELWSDVKYRALNVIYKAAKNPEKLITALAKHEKTLRSFIDMNKDVTDYSVIGNSSRRAFEAIVAYYEGKIEASEIQQEIEPAIMYQRMLGKIKEIYDNELVVDEWRLDDGLTAVIRSYAVFDYLKAILGSVPNDYSINASVLCAADYGAPQKRRRFVVMGIKRTITQEVKMPKGRFAPNNYRTVRDAIQDIQDVPVVTEIIDDVGTELRDITEISELGAELRDCYSLKNHMITKTTDIAMQRFKKIKQGQNFHSLDEDLKTNTYTDVSRTQNTIYLRLNYNEPSGTVVNVRKSMWIHPELDRAISVREAARLQTFPDSFVFCGTKDKQYQQVGNAVPPIMAKAIAKKLASQLNKNILKEDKDDEHLP